MTPEGWMEKRKGGLFWKAHASPDRQQVRRRPKEAEVQVDIPQFKGPVLEDLW